METLIFDTSALFNFGHRDDLQFLLVPMAGEFRLVTTPNAVAELTDPKRKAFYAALIRDHFKVQSATSVPFDLTTLARLAATIDQAEITVLALAKELNATAVLDETAARREAGKLSIKLTGTLGLLHGALQKGWLTDAECLEKVRLLQSNGFNIRRPGANESFADYFKSFP